MNDIAQESPRVEEAAASGECSHAFPTKLEGLIRRHPVAAAFASVGIGCAVGIVTRMLLADPPPPQNRALRLLDDIQHRFGDLAHPAYNRVSHLAEDGAHAVRSGFRSAADSKVADRLKHLFS